MTFQEFKHRVANVFRYPHLQTHFTVYEDTRKTPKFQVTLICCTPNQMDETWDRIKHLSAQEAEDSLISDCADFSQRGGYFEYDGFCSLEENKQ